MKVSVFSTHRFEQSYLESANQGKHDLKFIPTYLNKETAKLAEGSEAVSLFVNDDGSSSVLESLASFGVRYLALRSAGYNHVNLKRAKELGLKVANVPEYSPYAVAEHAVTLMLALNRKIIKAHNRVRDLNFSLDGLVGFDMHQKTVGIIGTGKIGKVVARILSGFGCRLLGYDTQVDQDMIEQCHMQYTSLEDLCEQSDIITLHVPLGKSYQIPN